MFSPYSVSWWEPNKGIDIFLGKQIKPPKKQNLISRYLWGSIREVAGHAGSVDLIRFVIPSFVAPNRNRSRPTGRRDGHITIVPACATDNSALLFYSFFYSFPFWIQHTRHLHLFEMIWLLTARVCVCVCLPLGPFIRNRIQQIGGTRGTGNGSLIGKATAISSEMY